MVGSQGVAPWEVAPGGVVPGRGHGPPAGVAAGLMPALLMARGALSQPLGTAVHAALCEELAFALQGSVRHPAASRTRANRIASLFVDDPARIREVAGSVLAAEAHGPEATVAAVVLSNLCWAETRIDEGLYWGREAVGRVDGETPPAWAPYPAIALAAKLTELGDHPAAEELLAGAHRTAARAGADAALADAALVRGRVLMATGDLVTAQHTVTEALELATAAGDAWAVPYGLLLLAMIALRRGDLREASDRIWRCRLERATMRPWFPSVAYDWGEYLVAAAYLDPVRATELMTTAYGQLLTPMLFVADPGAAPWLVRIALAAGDPLFAARVVGMAERLAADNPGHRSIEVTAQHARALVHRDTGALEPAAREHRDALAAALARQDLAALLAVHGPAAPDEQPGAAALTDTEREVARLVAAGLTNDQVARALGRSPHTVNYHLRRIFRKLDIGSRVELARYLYATPDGDAT